jgi:glycine cleavage system pyridoxal-binding protein P
MSAAPFVRRHIGPSPEDIAQMSRAVGVQSLDQLINETIPEDIRLRSSLSLPPARSEEAALKDLREIMERNELRQSLIGMGYANCHMPAVIRESGLVHRVHAISSRDRAGATGGPPQLPNSGLRFDGDGYFQRVAP